jgi:hypothetical protein
MRVSCSNTFPTADRSLTAWPPHCGKAAGSSSRITTGAVSVSKARIPASDDPGFDFFRLSFESLRGAIVDAGLLSAEDADAVAAGFGENIRLLTPLMIAGIGRRT